MRRIKFRKYVLSVLLLAFISVATIGCGSTVNGIGKDVKRVGRGIKTIFVRGAEE